MSKSNTSKEEYNSEPVLYCKHCLSLSVRSVPGMEDSDYCDVCSGTDIGECSIEEWEKMYQERYGHKYIEQY